MKYEETGRQVVKGLRRICHILVGLCHYRSWSCCRIPGAFIPPCSMSEIALRTLGRTRKSKTGYAALPDEEQDEHSNGHAASNGDDMPSSARAAAAATSSRRTRRGGRERYADDPEEAAGLLAAEDGEDGAYREDPEQGVRAVEEVRG